MRSFYLQFLDKPGKLHSMKMHIKARNYLINPTDKFSVKTL